MLQQQTLLKNKDRAEPRIRRTNFTTQFGASVAPTVLGAHQHASPFLFSCFSLLFSDFLSLFYLVRFQRVLFVSRFFLLFCSLSIFPRFVLGASVSFVFLRGVSLRCHVFVFSCFNLAFVALTHVSWWCWTCATLNIFFRSDVTCDHAAPVFFFKKSKGMKVSQRNC